MTTIKNNRVFILILLSLSACVAMSTTLRPVHGQAEEDDLTKKVESLTKQVNDQKKQIDSLQTEYQKFSADQEQWDKTTNTSIQNLNTWATNQGQWNKGTNTTLQGINNRLSDYVKFRTAQELWNKRIEDAFVQQRTAIQNINARLTRARIP